MVKLGVDKPLTPWYNEEKTREGNKMVKPRVYKALLEWERKKSLDNFRRVYRECFTGGNFIWRTWRIIRNTITGRYVEMLEMYENSVDI